MKLNELNTKQLEDLKTKYEKEIKDINNQIIETVELSKLEEQAKKNLESQDQQNFHDRNDYDCRLTVDELIVFLLKIEDKTKKVNTEGCDCIGDAVGVSEDSDSILITRR